MKGLKKWRLNAGFKKPDDIPKVNTIFKICVNERILTWFLQPHPGNGMFRFVLEAMNAGKHAATEVPAALTITECWQLIETSEKTGKHCIMMENCNYDREEMIILNMVKKGVFGEMLHARCGYLHDLRAVKHDMNGEGVWRRELVHETKW